LVWAKKSVTSMGFSTKDTQSQKCGSQYSVDRVFASICWPGEIRGDIVGTFLFFGEFFEMFPQKCRKPLSPNGLLDFF